MTIYLVLAIVALIIIGYFTYTLFKHAPDLDIQKKSCNFKITKPRIKQHDNIKTATFNIYVKNYHKFFIEFPILFKFYSNFKFKSRIKIGYSLPGDDLKEEIFKEEIEFVDQVKEHYYKINDIILGKIHIEIECETEYGKPIISFEILENCLCKLDKIYKLEIKF